MRPTLQPVMYLPIKQPPMPPMQSPITLFYIICTNLIQKIMFFLQSWWIKLENIVCPLVRRLSSVGPLMWVCKMENRLLVAWKMENCEKNGRKFQILQSILYNFPSFKLPITCFPFYKLTHFPILQPNVKLFSIFQLKKGPFPFYVLYIGPPPQNRYYIKGIIPSFAAAWVYVDYHVDAVDLFYRGNFRQRPIKSIDRIHMIIHINPSRKTWGNYYQALRGYLGVRDALFQNPWKHSISEVKKI